MPTRRPVLRANFESNLPGLYIIGDLAGAPVVKLAMEQGSDLAEHIASEPDARGGDPAVYDLIVIGAGAAGLAIEDFPEGKWVYAEPDSRPPLPSDRPRMAGPGSIC